MTTIVTDVQQPDYPKYQQTKNFELTQEEAEVWVACVNGSSIIMPTFTVAAMGYGLCKLSSFRSYAGYAGIISGMVGMIVGRIVISRKCLKKVASMPNSTLTERLIEAGYYRGRPMPHRESLYYRGPQSQSELTETQSPAEPSTGVVFNDYPQMNTYDTYSSDFHVSEDAELTEPTINLQKGVTYDELRRKNRDEFYKKSTQWRASGAPTEPPVEKARQQVPTADNPPSMQEKTKYGDVWG
ncbi:PREDICTED: OCIA domain-containing protein 1 [Vollenhovia emeryi]|uniref:OCIA domain-containing protein 1 n=1 Tax=Vollenhovia emeryi TaxID=411798 RepID=UPI0005F4A72E|nr:PREDICTED: OCIA domain-containing protein 1 [Vollenhovia emeryi]